MSGKNFCPPSVFVTRCEIPPHETAHHMISYCLTDYHMDSPTNESLVRVALGAQDAFS